jgi:hypothetical protein
VSPSWIPRDQHELTAGWRLWLELGSSAWPRPGWDGRPGEAVRGLRELTHACNGILADYLADGGSDDADVAALIRSMFVAASWTCELWTDDAVEPGAAEPLDADRLALLHGDLAGFADHAGGVRALLAEGGGWTSLSI